VCARVDERAREREREGTNGRGRGWLGGERIRQRRCSNVMLCTTARVVPNNDGKPNHLIPFGLRDAYKRAEPRYCVSLRARLAVARRRSTRRRMTATPREG